MNRAHHQLHRHSNQHSHDILDEAEDTDDIGAETSTIDDEDDSSYAGGNSYFDSMHHMSSQHLAPNGFGIPSNLGIFPGRKNNGVLGGL